MKHEGGNIAVREAIASNIRALRTKSGFNQTKFAEMIQVNRSYINQIERGKMNVSIDILVKIADGLDTPLPRLFEGLEVSPPRNLDKNVSYAAIAMPDETNKKGSRHK